MKYNLHTHSFYCRHGEGTVQDFVDEAKKDGYELLGFSEHSPFPDRVLEDNLSRMYFTDKPLFERDVREAAKKADFPILLGYECDMWPGEESYLRELNETTDFLIFGLHFLPGADGRIMSPFGSSIAVKGNLGIYCKTYMKALEMGIFKFAAHPDVFMCSYPKWDEEAKAVSKDIIQASVQVNMPLEVNGNGIDKALSAGKKDYDYPHREFWEMACEMGALCVFNMDAHIPYQLGTRYNITKSFCKEMGLKMVEPSWDGSKLSFK